MPDSIPAHDDTLSAALTRHGLELPPEQVARLDAFARQLWDWNTRINLTRHTDYDRFVSRDLADTLMFSQALPEGERVLDVGTGGGLPGVPLSILRDDLFVVLLDNVGKKIRAVEAIAKEIGLSIPAFHDRVQEHLEGFAYDTLIVRAVAPLPKLLKWLTGRWGAFRRLLVVKGPNWQNEFDEAEQAGLTRGLQVRRLATYPLAGTESESVILELVPTAEMDTAPPTAEAVPRKDRPRRGKFDPRRRRNK